MLLFSELQILHPFPPLSPDVLFSHNHQLPHRLPLSGLSASQASLSCPWQSQEVCPGALRMLFSSRLLFFLFFSPSEDRVSCSSGYPGAYLWGPGCPQTLRGVSYDLFEYFFLLRQRSHCQASLELLDARDDLASAFQEAGNAGP